MEWETFALVVTMILMAISLVLVVVPVLPGTVIMWAVATFYGLILGWEQLGWTTFFILTVLMAIGVAADIFAGHVGAKVGGASWLAIVVGMILGVLFAIVPSITGLAPLGCFSGIIGMVVGIIGVEWYRNENWEEAWQATKGYCTGATIGMLAKLVTGITMFGVFTVSVLFM